ncbi:hypothetical protein PC128_g10411 [Phytophthora cactorum]|nr:hypothetical protein PC128_g10411 [Phytophthora cactorum]
MQSFAVLHALLLLFIVAVHGATSDEDIQLSEAFGGSGGVAFSDIELVEFGQTAHTITINAKERITAVILRVATPAELTFSHGGCSGTDDTLTLEAGDSARTRTARSPEELRPMTSPQSLLLKVSSSAGSLVARREKFISWV